ncbi:SpoIIE family protein phosphatase [bacterium]|nr:SpoIIE family protein phosphatase [bacterium]
MSDADRKKPEIPFTPPEKNGVSANRIEQELRESEEKYRTLTENITLGIFRSSPSPKGRFIEVNSAFVSMLGYADKQELFNVAVARIYQDQQERVRFSEKIAQTGSVKNEELHLKKKDGTPIIVSVTAIAVRQKDGGILCYDGIVEDISERKKAEEEFRVQKVYLERLFNSAPEAIVLHDIDDRVVNVNAEFTRMFGYSREEAIGKYINDLVASDRFLDEAGMLSQKVTHGQRVEADSQRKRKDGTVVDVWILGAPIMHDGEQIGVYAIYRDITERRKAEEARIRSKEEARMARKIQMNFLPKCNPVISGYDIAGRSIPASNVGGDYYDFIFLDDHRLAIGLGDVSGHGLPAALVMANLQATIRGQALFDADPATALGRANKLLFQSISAQIFVSLFYGILDTRTHTLTYANAGQEVPVLFSNGSEPLSLKTRGMALGMIEDVVYENEEIPISPGDRLLICSDGIREAMNARKEELGEEQIRAIVQHGGDLSADALTLHIMDAVKAHFAGAPQNDDMTAVVLLREEDN